MVESVNFPPQTFRSGGQTLKMTFFPARIFFGVATSKKTKRLGSPVKKSCTNLYQIEKITPNDRKREPPRLKLQSGGVVHKHIVVLGVCAQVYIFDLKLGFRVRGHLDRVEGLYYRPGIGPSGSGPLG